MSKPRALNLDLWLCYQLHKASTITWVAGLKSTVWERMWVCQLQWKHVHLAVLLDVTAQNSLELDSGHTQQMLQFQPWFGKLDDSAISLLIFFISLEFSWFSSGAEFTHPSPRTRRLLPPSLYTSISFRWHSPLPRNPQSSLPLRMPSPAWKIRVLWMPDSFDSLCVIRANTALLLSRGLGAPLMVPVLAITIGIVLCVHCTAPRFCLTSL